MTIIQKLWLGLQRPDLLYDYMCGQRINPTILHPGYLHLSWLSKNIENIANTQDKKQTIIDVGGGTAPYKKLFEFDRYVVLDMNPGASVDILCDADKIPIDDDSVNLVLCTEALEHMQNPDKCIAEIYRILKPTGRIIVSVPASFPYHECPIDLWRWTKEGIKYSIEDAGFKNVELSSIGSNISSLGLMMIELDIKSPLPGIIKRLFFVPLINVLSDSIEVLTLLYHSGDCATLTSGYVVTAIK